VERYRSIEPENEEQVIQRRENFMKRKVGLTLYFGSMKFGMKELLLV